jgi:hypothetical protein
LIFITPGFSFSFISALSSFQRHERFLRLIISSPPLTPPATPLADAPLPLPPLTCCRRQTSLMPMAERCLEFIATRRRRRHALPPRRR